MNDADFGISTTTVHSLLGTKTRCQVITLLLEAERTWDVETLAAELVRLDPTLAPDGAQVENHTDRLATRLYHCTLPKLADEDVVDFDHDAMVVTPGENLSAVGAYLGESLDCSEASVEQVSLNA
ncbi:DUF7344 domain-containing protein [Halomarina rubra]|uniref:DUF7344 domain-containing protein n=1 Tax=Halomarina rubra TaxID=2071873 RepID=A0ABD6AW02_9EURY|nr:hypothetical protein [Halomarina rubra]